MDFKCIKFNLRIFFNYSISYKSGWNATYETLRLCSFPSNIEVLYSPAMNLAPEVEYLRQVAAVKIHSLERITPEQRSSENNSRIMLATNGNSPGVASLYRR